MHGYHGVTHRDDAYGWVIQIKIMGRYQMLRTFAEGADTAARRHDMALQKLDAFTEPNARPNFPADFDKIDLSRAAAESPSDKQFFDELQSFFVGLCKEAEAIGMDPSQMRTERAKLSKRFEATRKLKATLAYTKFMDRLAKLRAAVSSLPLPVAKREQISDMLVKTEQIIEGH